MALDAETQAAVDQWLKWDIDERTVAELRQLLEDGSFDEVRSRFAARIKFGTAGLRGRMQAGPSSLNCLTVLQASQGLAKRISKEFEDKATAPKGVAKAVCIGRDGRHNSETFSKIAASAFIAEGIAVHFFPTIVPTPLVAFCVKHLNLAAGVMVTASHNPKDDNGYKVYWQRGSQIVPPIDAEIQESILLNLTPQDGVSAAAFDAYEGPLVQYPLKEISDAYYAEVEEKCCFFKEANEERRKAGKAVKTVFTAMHGVGKDFVARSLDVFGLDPYIPVQQQIEADPDFPTVPFPNPEEGKGALKLAIETAEANNAPIIMANDPDSDRFAAAEKQENGEWKIFTGNELGILFGNWTWQNYKRRNPDVDPSTCAVFNTTVSSKMLKSLADVEGLYYEETLTGFKWLGTLAQKKMDEGMNFLFCFEEAIGYLIFDICLDKDGVRTAGMFAEMVNQLYDNGNTVSGLLNELYEKYGYFASNNRYFFCYSPPKMEKIFARMRTMGPDGGYVQACGDFKISGIRDLTTGFDSTQPDNKAVLPVSSSSQMITFYFANGGVVTLRGSGTEPKLKYYCELKGESKEKTEAVLDGLVKAVIADLLEPEKNELEAPKD